MTDCIYEKNIIKNAVQHATESLQFHRAALSSEMRSFISSKRSDYFNYMNIVFKNVDRLTALFGKFELLYSNSQRMREYYKLLAEYYSNRMHLPIKLKSGTDEAIEAVKKIGDLKELKEYYGALQSKKLKLSDNKVIVSSEITDSEKEIKSLDEFDEKIRVTLLKAGELLTGLKTHIKTNIDAIGEAENYVTIVTDAKTGMEDKLKLVSLESFKDGSNGSVGGVASLGLFSKEEIDKIKKHKEEVKSLKLSKKAEGPKMTKKRMGRKKGMIKLELKAAQPSIVQNEDIIRKRVEEQMSKFREKVLPLHDQLIEPLGKTENKNLSTAVISNEMERNSQIMKAAMDAIEKEIRKIRGPNVNDNLKGLSEELAKKAASQYVEKNGVVKETDALPKELSNSNPFLKAEEQQKKELLVKPIVSPDRQIYEGKLDHQNGKSSEQKLDTNNDNKSISKDEENKQPGNFGSHLNLPQDNFPYLDKENKNKGSTEETALFQRHVKSIIENKIQPEMQTSTEKNTFDKSSNIPNISNTNKENKVPNTQFGIETNKEVQPKAQPINNIENKELSLLDKGVNLPKLKIELLKDDFNFDAIRKDELETEISQMERDKIKREKTQQKGIKLTDLLNMNIKNLDEEFQKIKDEILNKVI